MATILIVDDLAAHRNQLVTLLRDQGHQVLAAANGREGLAAVQAGHPDAVITEVLMPEMDGYEFVRRLRLDPATSRLPVAFLTAHHGAREAEGLARSGKASDVLLKPAESVEVLRIVSRLLPGDSKNGAPSLATALAMETDREHLQLLADKLSESVEDLRTSNARLRALINIGLDLASERDVDRLLHIVCTAACDLFGATYVTLAILDLKDRTVQRFVTCGTDADDWINKGDSVAGILAAVVAERRSARGHDPSRNPSGPQFPPRHPEVQAFLAAPIASPANVYGWMCLVGNEGRTFSENDEHLVNALSGLVGRIYESGHFARVSEQRAAALAHEVVEREHAEEALRLERDRAQRYLDTAEVMLIALDRTGRITLANRHACSVLGWSADELRGRDWIDTCLPAGIRAAWRHKFQDLVGGNLPAGENAVITKSGEERLIEWHNTVLRDEGGLTIGTLSSGTDITERRTLEQQYRQAQKMEAVGQVVGGVAHDFNNLLTVILGYCELVLEDLAPNHARRADLAEIQRAGAQASALTRQLLAFSRKEVVEPRRLDINVVIGGMRKMLGLVIRENVTIVMALEPALAHVNADRGQLEQIVMNLAVNARDAMPNGGTLTIETANVEIDNEPHLDLKPGPHVVLTVTDTGTGITPEVRARLFEPFFTTKPAGRGTGLGLATVRDIARRSGGDVRVDSEVGHGASFRVFLPKSDATATVGAPPLARPRAGTQTVLVVDDSQGLCELASRLLTRQGYTVLVAASADEARQQFERHPSIDVLLTDVVMPGGSGPELAQQLVARWPLLKVVYMSGYPPEVIVQHGVMKPGITFLRKPFTSETLGRKIGEALDQ